MKKNNKGFMLVEVIIVTVVVVSIMTSLYVAFNKIYESYNKKSVYTNVDAIYAIKTIEDYMIDKMEFNSLLNNTNEFNEITCDSIDTFCNSIFTQYKINQLFLMKKQLGNPLSTPNGINQTFKDYISYLNNAVVNDTTSNYIFVVETYENGTDENISNKYAYLEIK